MSNSISANFTPTQLAENVGPKAGAREAEVAKEFEALFLSQFVDQVMSTVEVKSSGGGQGAEMWRSFLSQAIADQLVEQGGLGLKTNVEQMLAAYKR